MSERLILGRWAHLGRYTEVARRDSDTRVCTDIGHCRMFFFHDTVLISIRYNLIDS